MNGINLSWTKRMYIGYSTDKIEKVRETQRASNETRKFITVSLEKMKVTQEKEWQSHKN